MKRFIPLIFQLFLIIFCAFAVSLFASGAWDISGSNSGSLSSYIFGRSSSGFISTVGGTPGFSNPQSVQFVKANTSNLDLVTTSLNRNWSQPTSWLFWIYITAIGPSPIIWNSYLGAPNNGFEIIINPTQQLDVNATNAGAGGTSWDVHTANNALSTNTWQHVAIVYDGLQESNGSGSSLYINGVIQSVTNSGNLAADFLASTAPKIAQYNGSNSNSFDGYMNMAAYYSKLLSQADITAAYNNGHIVDLSTLPSYSNIIYWYRMGNCAGDTTATIKNCANPGTFDATGNNITLVTQSPPK